jgi:hypothetical protein
VDEERQRETLSDSHEMENEVYMSSSVPIRVRRCTMSRM